MRMRALSLSFQIWWKLLSKHYMYCVVLRWNSLTEKLGRKIYTYQDMSFWS